VCVLYVFERRRSLHSPFVCKQQRNKEHVRGANSLSAVQSEK
jgi:hypothetical protein